MSLFLSVGAMAVDDPAVMDVNTSTVYTIQFNNDSKLVYCNNGEIYYEGIHNAANANNENYQFKFEEAATDAQGRKLYYIASVGQSGYYAYNENGSNAGGAAGSVGLTNDATTKTDKGVWYVFNDGSFQYIVPAWKEGNSYTRGGCCWNMWSSSNNNLGMWGRGTSDPNYAGDNQLFIVEVEQEVVVSSLSDFKQDMAYTITCDRGAWVVDGTFKTSGDAHVSADATNANQQFAVLTLDKNDYYLYSVGGKGFVKSNGNIANAGDPIQLNDASSHATGRVQIQFKGTSTYVNMGGSNQTALDGWNTVDAGNAVKFLEVAEFTDTEEALKKLAKGLLGEAVAEYDAKSAISGEGLGKFSCTLEGYETEVEEINAYYQNIPETATKEEIFAKVTRLGEIIDAFTLNMPKAGSYIRVAYDYGGTIGTLYMQGETSQNSANKTGVKFTSDKGASSIWYYDGTSLISYTKGVCIAEAGNTRGLQAIGATQQVTFSACDRATGKYFVQVPHYIHANTANTEHFSDHCPNDGNRCAQHCLILEDVTELPVTVTAAGYATFYAPVAVAVPTGVTAHTVTIKDKWATLTAIEGGVIPANTGVVLVAGEGSHNFAITTTDATATSALLGTAAATYFTTDAYLLGYDDITEDGVDNKEAYFGLASKNLQENTSWKNGSHKAYLPAPANSEGVKSYSFRFGEGTTGINEVKGENGNVKTIYDLTGRRVEAITAPGIYIVNGKKVLVK